ncbi:MAG: CapA family protein [Cyclobacteriaceae bacterium]
MLRGFFLMTMAIAMLYGCKTTKLASSSNDVQPIQDSVTSPSIDSTTYLITMKGDTLESLDLEVDIGIERLLPNTVSIAAVGDIMMGTNYPNKSYLPPGNGELLWDASKSYLQEADISFGNLEGTVLDGEGDPKDCKNPKACYLFRMPSRLTSNLVECGFDLMSLANNHANDFGAIGRKSTQQILDSLDIAFAGSIESPYGVFKIDALKIGFVAFAPNKGTLTFYDEERALAIIKELDSLSDMIIISIHGGAEGAKNQHVTREREFYYGEDRGNIYEFSHKLVDQGADVILGHGPHVPRGLEVYKKRMIAYSLGNFCTYGRFNLKGANAIAPLLMTHVNSEGEFLSGEIISFRQTYSQGPIFDTNGGAARSIKKLSEEDFPENEIIIDEKGRIIYIQN